MKKSGCLLFVFLLLVLSMRGQTLDEIKNSGDYLYGIGEGRTFREADKSALDVLISQISVQVESNFESLIKQEEGNVKEYTEIVLKTYSNTALQQAKSMVIEETPENTVVIRYITKSDKEKIFNNRERKIKDYTSSALNAENEYRIADAIKYYYWALVLLRSHPDYNSITYEFPGEGERLMITTLQDRLNRTFSMIDVDITKIIEKPDQAMKSVMLRITFLGHPVQNFDYVYWTGNTWSHLVSSRNGMGVVQLYGEASQSLDKIRLKIEYIFENKSKLDLELHEILKNARTPFFTGARIQVSLMDPQEPEPKTLADEKTTKLNQEESSDTETTDKHRNQTAKSITEKNEGSPLNTAAVRVDKEESAVSSSEESDDNQQEDISPAKSKKEKTAAATPVNKEEAKVTHASATYAGESEDQPDIISQCEKLSRKAIEYSTSKEYDAAREIFTSEGYEMYDRLINYGEAEVLNENPELKLIKLHNRVFARSVPVKFSFPHNNREFIEEIVFTCNDSNKIEGLTMSLSDMAINDIMGHSRWDDKDKFTLIEFMENYKTAYALKRIDYIESIFADNALIIVGQKLKKAEPIDDMYKSLGKNYSFQYIKLTKAEYMERLNRVFRSNEFVNIHFEDNEVKRKGKDRVYGIQIAQNYYSTNYADKGYLFLMIDLNDTLNPKIYVRSWQPEKNTDGSIIGLQDFHF